MSRRKWQSDPAYIVQPAHAFLFLDGHTRRVDRALERSGALELRAGPEFDGRQTQRQPVRGDG